MIQKVDISVSRETQHCIDVYIEELRVWQKSFNLVGSSTLDDVYQRHILDSLQLLSFNHESYHTWVDLGSGAGIPGLIIASALVDKKDVCIHLVESNQKKCAFLRFVSKKMYVPVRIHQKRIEALGTSLEGDISVVTARGVASLEKLLFFYKNIATKNTVGLFLKGKNVFSEISEAEKTWSFKYQLSPSKLSNDGFIIQVSSVEKIV